jgi:hypothetical protein
MASRDPPVEVTIELPRRVRQSPPRALDRGAEAMPVDRLEHVVDRMHVERAKCMLVVSGDEDDRGHARDTDRFDDVETADLGHLDVEKNEIGCELRDCVDRRRSITAFTDDLEVGFAPQLLADAAPRDRLVVDDEHANHAGISSETIVPPSR